MSAETSKAQDVRAIADRFIAALNGTDSAAVRAFYTPDATFWHNFDDHSQSVAENMRLFEWMLRKAPQRHYRVLRFEPIPGGWMQQHVLEAELPNGRRMKMFACCLITLKGDLIHRLEEYLDPAQAAVLREV